MRDWKRVWSGGNITIEISYDQGLVTIIDSDSPASCLTFDEARAVAIALSQMISLFSDDEARELAETINGTEASCTDVHTWFGLTYSNYLVLNRSVLQSMPDDWQHRFVRCLDEMQDTYGGLPWPYSYSVSPRDSDGKFIKDPIPHYNRGRTHIEPCPYNWNPEP